VNYPDDQQPKPVRVHLEPAVKPIPYYVKALLLALPAVLIGIQISWWIVCLTSPARERSVDFRMYYGAARMMREGHASSLYDPTADTEVQNRTVAPDGDIHLFTHPAYELWLLFPLAYFPFHAAYLVLAAVNVILVWLIYRKILLHLTAFLEMRPWLPFALFLTFLPIPLAILQGQDSLVFALLVVAAFTRVREDDLLSAGVLLGLASFRFQYTLIFLALFLVWKAWKFLAGFLASALACFLLSVAASGWRAQFDYLHLLRAMSDSRTSITYTDRVTPPVLYMVNLRGLITALGGGLGWILAASVVVIMIAALIGCRVSRVNQFLLATIATCLVSYHTFAYDLSILILPLTILMDSALRDRNYKLLVSVALAMAMPELVALTVPFAKTWLNSVGVLALFVVACKWVRFGSQIATVTQGQETG